MLSEGLVIHEQVNHVTCRGIDVILEPSEILLGSKRPLSPAPVRESECDIVAERVVSEKEFQSVLPVIGIYEIRASPCEDMLCA